MDHTGFTLQQHHTCLYLVKNLQDGATTDSDNSRLVAVYYSFIDTKRMKSCDGLVSWPTGDAWFTHINGYHQLQVRYMPGKVHWLRDGRSSTELYTPLTGSDGRVSQSAACFVSDCTTLTNKRVRCEVKETWVIFWICWVKKSLKSQLVFKENRSEQGGRLGQAIREKVSLKRS